VNLILSAGIIFDIVGYVVTSEAASDPATIIKFWIGIIMAVFLVIMAIIYFVNRSKK
ncbi:MAG: hypothetical protein RBG13Loki_2624, partial [Promethearchaeota archaeon CR_4]